MQVTQRRTLLDDLGWLLAMYGVPHTDQIVSIHAEGNALVVETTELRPELRSGWVDHTTTLPPLAELDASEAATPIFDQLRRGPLGDDTGRRLAWIEAFES